jgi:hypothetical protein
MTERLAQNNARPNTDAITFSCEPKLSMDASVTFYRELRGDSIPAQRQPFSTLHPPTDAARGSSNFIEVPVLRLGETASEEATQIFRKQDETAKIYEKSKNAVVRIYTQRDGSAATGSGFFIDKDGTVATDYHVIRDAKSIQLTTSDGRSFPAKLDKHRSTADLAVLKADTGGRAVEFSALPLAKTAESLNPGDKVFALGHPHGWEKLYLSTGSVYKIKSGATLGFNPQRLSVDAYIHIEGGNSGGPLLNSKGEVVGLTRTAVLNANEKSEVMRELTGTDELKAQFTTVDDLRGLLGKHADDTKTKSYIFPERLRTNSEQIVSTFMAAGSGFAAAADWRGKGTIWGGAILPASAATQLYYTDLPFLKTAIFDGTTADRINAGINVGSNLMMMSGPALRYVPRLKQIAGSVQAAGAGIRMTNDWLAGRRFD